MKNRFDTYQVRYNSTEWVYVNVYKHTFFLLRKAVVTEIDINIFTVIEEPKQRITNIACKKKTSKRDRYRQNNIYPAEWQHNSNKSTLESL